MIRHGNNYGLFKKMQKKKIFINRVVVASTILVITVIISVAIITSAIVFQDKNSSMELSKNNSILNNSRQIYLFT